MADAGVRKDNFYEQDRCHHRRDRIAQARQQGWQEIATEIVNELAPLSYSSSTGIGNEGANREFNGLTTGSENRNERFSCIASAVAGKIA